MISELWSVFPHLIVQKINGLLDEAEPNPTRAFMIYKSCQSEGLWTGEFEEFSKALQTFFSRSKVDRKKSQFDAYLERPMDMDIYEKFHLGFRSALVNNKTLTEIASWAHHLTRVGYKTTCPVASEEVFTKTLNYITNPPPHEKDENIDFEDFCAAWSKTVTKLFGKTYEFEFTSLLKETRWLQRQMKETEIHFREGQIFPTIYLTQTEIDWTEGVQKAVVEYLPAPKFPLSKGPQKQRLCELYSAIGLYKLVQGSKDPRFVKHRNILREKILEQCASLLRECAR